MRIAINGYILSKGISGSAIGLRKIHESLLRLGHEVIIISPQKHYESRILNLLYLIMWDLWLCTRKAVRLNSEFLIHPCNTGLSTSRIKSLLVIHDTMVIDFKRDFDRGYHIYATIMFWLSARGARVIMTASEFSKKSIENHWQKKNIIVNYWPIKPVTKSLNENTSGEWTVLWNAAMENHKQPLLLLEIIKELRSHLDGKLYCQIITRDGNASENFKLELQKIWDWREWISIQSGLSESELARIYSMTDVLLVTSRAEGFCLPALEAMSYGVPVIHSNIPALIEVCGRSYEDGHPRNSMVQGCLRYFREPEVFEIAKSKARTRSLAFSEDVFDEKLSLAIAKVLEVR